MRNEREFSLYGRRANPVMVDMRPAPIRARKRPIDWAWIAGATCKLVVMLCLLSWIMAHVACTS